MKNELGKPKTVRYSAFFLKLLPLIAFVFPLALLYLLNPIDTALKVSAQTSFELMWKGRTFQLFFIWLIALEFILGWETIKTTVNLHNRTRAVGFAVALLLPTLYLVLGHYCGLNSAIADCALQNGVAFSDSMPLAFEYLAFSGFFCLAILVTFGKKGLSVFALPALFAALVGVLYTIDNVFPYGAFTPFQLIVPTTAMLAAGVLSFMGFSTVSGYDVATGMPTLDVTGVLGSAKFAIAWPCAGIESLLIFTAVALVFLKRINISWKAKIGLFAFGAGVTYFINILRIANIFTIGMQFGVNSNEVQMFHFYYGPLYAMVWIITYPLIIMASTAAYRRIRKHQSEPLNPA